MTLPWTDPIDSVSMLEIIYMYLIFIFIIAVIGVLVGYKSEEELLKENNRLQKEILAELRAIRKEGGSLR